MPPGSIYHRILPSVAIVLKSEGKSLLFFRFVIIRIAVSQPPSHSVSDFNMRIRPATYMIAYNPADRAIGEQDIHKPGCRHRDRCWFPTGQYPLPFIGACPVNS